MVVVGMSSLGSDSWTGLGGVRSLLLLPLGAVSPGPSLAVRCPFLSSQVPLPCASCPPWAGWWPAAPPPRWRWHQFIPQGTWRSLSRPLVYLLPISLVFLF